MDLPTDSPQVHDEVVSALSAAGMHPWVWDICTGRVAWSQEIDAMFGLAKGASVTTYEAYMLSLPSEARPVVEAAIERTLTGLAPEYYVEHRVADLGEAPRWVAGRGRVVRDAEGKPLRLAGVVWDITKRKEAEAGLARVNRQWSMVREIHRQILHTQSQTELFETACHVAVDVGGFRLAWVGLVTPDGARLLPTARRGHDTAVLDALRLDLRSPVPSIDATARAAREGRHIVVNDLGLVHNLPPCMAAAYALGHKSVAALPLRQKERIVGVLTVTSDAVGAFDDEQVDMLVSLVNDLGHVLGVLDGEEQRRATEAALRSSEERYRSVFQQAFEGIFIVARSHAIVDANESSCRMLGYTREEMLQLSAEDVIHPEEFARVPIRFASIPAGGVILSERRFVRKDGSVMQGELSTKALLDGNFQVVVRDVTNRKQVQGQMLLTDRLSSLGRLASGVAHEINNPLAYVMLNLEMVSGWLRRLEHPNDPEAVVRLLAGLDDARDGAERMRRIVRTLSAFGRGDEERVGPVDVNGVLESAIEIASIQLRHRAKLVRRYDSVGPAKANAFRLGQVFLNLLVNAADALPEGNAGNEITLATRTRDDGWVLVEVKDNGAGLPLELQSRIFDPFFTTKAVGSGTGLGLAVCHAIVTSLDGSIVCESAPGHGTLFRVALPPAQLEPAAIVADSFAARAQGKRRDETG